MRDSAYLVILEGGGKKTLRLPPSKSNTWEVLSKGVSPLTITWKGGEMLRRRNGGNVCGDGKAGAKKRDHHHPMEQGNELGHAHEKAKRKGMGSAGAQWEPRGRRGKRYFNSVYARGKLMSLREIKRMRQPANRMGPRQEERPEHKYSTLRPLRNSKKKRGWSSTQTPGKGGKGERRVAGRLVDSMRGKKGKRQKTTKEGGQKCGCVQHALGEISKCFH